MQKIIFLRNNIRIISETEKEFLNITHKKTLTIMKSLLDNIKTELDKAVVLV